VKNLVHSLLECLVAEAFWKVLHIFYAAIQLLAVGFDLWCRLVDLFYSHVWLRGLKLIGDLVALICANVIHVSDERCLVVRRG